MQMGGAGGAAGGGVPAGRFEPWMRSANIMQSPLTPEHGGSILGCVWGVPWLSQGSGRHSGAHRLAES